MHRERPLHTIATVHMLGYVNLSKPIWAFEGRVFNALNGYAGTKDIGWNLSVTHEDKEASCAI